MNDYDTIDQVSDEIALSLGEDATLNPVTRNSSHSTKEEGLDLEED